MKKPRHSLEQQDELYEHLDLELKHDVAETGAETGADTGEVKHETGGYSDKEQMELLIHSSYALTRVFTAGTPLRAQPYPNDTNPTTVSVPAKKTGPPESPWQVSFPPFSDPLHTTNDSLRELPYTDRHDE